MNLQGNRITWLGHATFRIETKDGTTVYLDPWVMGNPMCPENEKQVKKADVLICTHGHFDHIGDAVAIGRQHNPRSSASSNSAPGWKRKAPSRSLP